MNARENRGFGSDVVQLLIPHRRPFLMVDRVDTWALEPVAELRASRHVSANELVFDGHFPGWGLWPGVYTIEGMGQSCMLLAVLKRICEAALERGLSSDDVSAAARELDRGFHLAPGVRPGLLDRLVESIGSPRTRIGMASTIDVKLLHPVFAGQRLDYNVCLTHDEGTVMRFDVEAAVEGRPVARGTIGSAFVEAATALPFVR
jgi:3-hydroxyacyl-[acyl-carrier-protein] dehydratase